MYRGILLFLTVVCCGAGSGLIWSALVSGSASDSGTIVGGATFDAFGLVCLYFLVRGCLRDRAYETDGRRQTAVGDPYEQYGGLLCERKGSGVKALQAGAANQDPCANRIGGVRVCQKGVHMCEAHRIRPLPSSGGRTRL